MNNKQIYNILKIALFCTLFLFGFELLFSFESINLWVGGLIENSTNKIITYIIVWLIMFLQVWLIPVPAYIVLLASTHAGLLSSGLFNIGENDIIFFFVTLSAYICGFIVAYVIGYKFGSKAVIWASGSKEEYEKWSKIICEKGKWWYALTVLLPCFPDDLLCFIAGSVKMDFKFYSIVNIICRAIGLFCMIELLKYMVSWNSGGLPITAICWGIVLLVILILTFIYKKKVQKNV